MKVHAKKYKPQLATLMNLCDVNYMLLIKLLADKEEVGQARKFFISDFLSYVVSVNEVTRYTTLVTISQDTIEVGKELSQLFQPKMVIRLYHDARMAEVITSQNIRQVKPRYDYPNSEMHLPDEKQQINMFLKEWLQLCHELGQVKVALNLK
ncbi:DUF1249 domain-containing protein [Pseudocolwellia sp. AS88]|uniref:DUF1249 domain-containing protein n=1 Tax=Pseudocolwellia sp. AS88 TaxID=3063958 RepID=UPI0026F002B5|nr:DUF1249 domain-containing protein [Pseudocolwellia sp. AS88]MDO7083790.1 DUF1249 domain-containing protein [Pseudocolwellia sp. AS88]